MKNKRPLDVFQNHLMSDEKYASILNALKNNNLDDVIILYEQSENILVHSSLCKTYFGPLDVVLAMDASYYGHLEILKYFLEKVSCYDPRIFTYAIKKGHLNIVRYLYEHKYDYYRYYAINDLIKQPDIMRFFIIKNKRPEGIMTVKYHPTYPKYKICREKERKNLLEDIQKILDICPDVCSIIFEYCYQEDYQVT